jgi:hypothetical protein
MDPRERIEAFWSGERPDRIPFTIYLWLLQQYEVVDDPALGPMYEAGLLTTWGLNTFGSRAKNVEQGHDSWTEEGQKAERYTMRTPVGEITSTYREGWHAKYFLETAADYRVMQYVVEHTEIFPQHEAFAQAEQEHGEHCIVHAGLGRSPIQTVLVDYAGLENFGWHLAELEEEIEALCEALLRNLRAAAEITAEGPGRYVSVLENFTADTMGPARFRRYHLPVYEELFPLLQSAGKIVGTHFDGRLASCQEAIAGSPIDLLESLTPPPEGDLTLAQARAAWPDKLFWSNINLETYDLPPERIRATVLEAVRQAAPDGRRLAFEVSEDLPRRWRESMPVILAALQEARG